MLPDDISRVPKLYKSCLPCRSSTNPYRRCPGVQVPYLHRRFIPSTLAPTVGLSARGFTIRGVQIFINDYGGEFIIASVRWLVWPEILHQCGHRAQHHQSSSLVLIISAGSSHWNHSRTRCSRSRCSDQWACSSPTVQVVEATARRRTAPSQRPSWILISTTERISYVQTLQSWSNRYKHADQVCHQWTRKDTRRPSKEREKKSSIGPEVGRSNQVSEPEKKC